MKSERLCELVEPVSVKSSDNFQNPELIFELQSSSEDKCRMF